jgi:uncharacterized membrane protein YjjP (DUF1212 family)
MNWKLIFVLSLFGVAMGVASLFGLTGKMEPVLWLVIFILYAYWIAKHVQSKHFLHGLLVSVLNGIWISVIHAAFSSTYFANNPEMLEGFRKLPRSFSPQAMMLVTGPLIGAATGLIAGLFAIIAAKILAKRSVQVDVPSAENPSP